MPITLNGTTGITTPGLINTGSTTFVDLTTTGNTILGDQSTDTLNVANGNLVLNSSGNLGIGTGSPTYKLEVNGNAYFNNITMPSGGVTIGTGTLGSISGAAMQMFGVGSGTYMLFYTNGAERLRLDSSGNLGLGVTPSALDIGRTIQVGFNSNTIWGATANNFQFLAGATYNNAYLYAVTGEAVSNYRQNAGQHQWYNAPSGTAGNAITFTQAMTLSAAGNLLVGATSGAGRLLIASSETKSSSATPLVLTTSDASNRFDLIFTRSTNSYYGIEAVEQGTAYRDIAMQFNGGSLLVGTTSSSTGIDTGLTKMFVVAPNSNFGAAITAVADSAGRTIRVTDQARSIQGVLDASSSSVSVGTNTAHVLRFLTGGTEKARIDTSGSFSITQSPGAYTIDTAAGAASIANGGTVDFANASGMLLVNNWANGAVTIYLCGGGNTSVVASVTGTVGTLSFVPAIGGYRWTNNFGSTTPFGFQFFRTRSTA